MNTILGIKFREYGQIYYFLAGQCAAAIGNRVIVETEQGQGIGEVVLIRDTLPASILSSANQDGTQNSAELKGISELAGHDGEATALLITNTITSAVVVPNADLTVADIPYASAVMAKAQALRQSEAASQVLETESVELDTPQDDDAASSSLAPGSHSHNAFMEYQSPVNAQDDEQENADGVLVASADMQDLEQAADQAAGQCADSNNIYSGRMVSYDGSAGEHSSDNQAPEDTSQPLSFDDLRPILRIATEYDLEHAMSNELLSREASAYCKECIKIRDLDMKLVDVEVFFDLSKFIFYFTAPSRIDFRELVKDLVKHYRTRIELRQIGVRHETQMIGAVGNCGMVCCCRRFLRKFAPVTIKMAKEQNLFLNPAKISGICGRLLCCLSYEQENYEEFHRRCPRLGKKYMTSKGPIKVMRANMFRNSLIAYSETGEELEIPLEEWHEMEVRRPDSGQQASRANRRDKSAGPDKVVGDKAVADKVVGDKVVADKAVADKGAGDKAPADASSSASAASTPTTPDAQTAGCSGTCGTCGQCGPNGSRGTRSIVAQPVQASQVSDAQMSVPQTAGSQTTDSSVGINPDVTADVTADVNPDVNPDKSLKADHESHRPLQATVHVAEQVMASLSGVHQPPSGVSEHGIPTTRARQAALVQSLAGMDGGPLCSITQADKPVSPAAIAATVIADVISVAEAAAKQAPASIVMSERLIKSTDTSALKTSRGRRKRRRKTRDGANGEAYSQDSTDAFPDACTDAFDDNDME